MQKLLLLFFLFGLCSLKSFSQTDSAARVIPQRRYNYLDSAALAKRQFLRDSLQRRKDSLKHISDSLSFVWVGRPDPNRPNKFIDSLIKLYRVEHLDFKAWAGKFSKKSNLYQTGKPHYKSEKWIIVTILFLITFFAILRYTFSKELSIIIQSFYSNRVLSQISKEDTLFSSWPFVFLYLLFGFTIGMFLFLSGRYFQLQYIFDGFEWFLILSGVIVLLFTLKIIILRLLGFLFGIQRLVREYVSILYLSYFNAAMLFLPLVLAYSLTSGAYAIIYNYIAIALLIVIFVFQFLRAGANILSNFRFPKTYLIIYLCALEICPIIILLKALRF